MFNIRENNDALFTQTSSKLPAIQHDNPKLAA